MDNKVNTYVPMILREGEYTPTDLEELKRKYKIFRISDIYDLQLQELFEISFPNLTSGPEFQKELSRFIAGKKDFDSLLRGNWVYFPWNGNLIHTLNEQDYFALRTNRNRELISTNEQNKLYKSCVAIAGLSVGSSVAVGLAYQGVAKNMKLAELDMLETSNLNRLKASLQDIGQSKLEIAAHQIFEINPYSDLKIYPSGLQEGNLDDFITSRPKPRVIFEIIDNFRIKILLRQKARAAKIPVISFANLGDKILLDIERYDLDENLTLFNGLLGDLPEQILDQPDANPHEYAIKMVERKNVPKRALASVEQIHKTLVGRPQLYSTTAASGAIGVYITRRLLLGGDMDSGRYLISLKEILQQTVDLDEQPYES